MAPLVLLAQFQPVEFSYKCKLLSQYSDFIVPLQLVASGIRPVRSAGFTSDVTKKASWERQVRLSKGKGTQAS